MAFELSQLRSPDAIQETVNEFAPRARAAFLEFCGYGKSRDLLVRAPKSGEQRAVFDLAWPNGLQEELSQPVAVLLHEDAATIKASIEAGFRVFADVQSFKRYVRNEVVGDPNQV
jgi:hypothetical protein